jgi:hypothetical protein
MARRGQNPLESKAGGVILDRHSTEEVPTMSSQTRTRTTRRLCHLIGASLLLMLGACAGLDPAGPPSVSPELAAGWEDHSRPLINHGSGLTTGTTAWMVPTILPRGNYRVISRRSGKVELIDGYRFEVDGSIGKEVRLMLPSNYSGVEAVDEKYVKTR